MKNKKSLIALVLIVIVGIIGFTYAYFSNSYNLSNEFETLPFNTSVNETIISPDDWVPGSTIEKNVIATNNSDVDVAVRISFTEEWKSSNDVVLDNEIDGVRLALINFSNESDWIHNGDYYYYRKKLSKNEQTNSLISSVTYNANAVNNTECENSNDGKSKKCITKITGYEGATYTLNIKIDLVQFATYQAAWGTNVVIN